MRKKNSNLFVEKMTKNSPKQALIISTSQKKMTAYHNTRVLLMSQKLLNLVKEWGNYSCVWHKKA
jgi:hypothetical protein